MHTTGQGQMYTIGYSKDFLRVVVGFPNAVGD